MTILVIAEHDNASIKAATLNTVGGGGEGRRRHSRAGRGPQCASGSGRGSEDRRVSKVLLADAPQLEAGLAENVEATALNIAKATRTSSRRQRPTARTSRRASPRSWTSRRSRHHGGRFGRHVRAPDLRGQRDRDGAVERSDQGHHGACDGFDPVAAEGGSASVEKIEAAADAGKSQFVSREVTKLDRPELTSQASSCRAAAAGQRRELHEGAGAAGRQASPRWAPRARPSTRATCRTTTRSARPARSSRRSCTSRSASRVRFSIWPA